ncbi:hypothetical protein EEW87_012660 [Janibacter melonis]|uniref:Uncharacterized protein n=1 Tax=Janibacter melonis TaxID=262209 RepID=A0A5P8FN42_9MICO|nr:hypothetical protein [Janibacter melonis]QFQ30975.2 hypothetical protein EEW87_012660 [Janibacter melonis]
MQSSSLIFVVVVAIWAAYLVQYWVRRRDHLATVRSVDRFSAAMRVLDSHRLSQTEEPTRSYAVSPARAARPEVVVKRTVTVPEAPVHEPELEDEGSGRLAVVSAVVDAPRQVRGLAFLGHLVLLPIALLFSAFGSLPWLVTGLLLVGLLGSFGWLRQDVKAAEARRREEHLARRRSREAAAPVRRPAPRRAPVHAETTTEVVVDEPERVVAEAAVSQTVATDAPFDVSAPVEAAPATEPAEVEAPAAVVDDREGTWEPVPVPRPTYTMKARAGARPVVEDAPAEDTPQVLDAIDDDVVAPQRAVGS